MKTLNDAFENEPLVNFAADTGEAQRFVDAVAAVRKGLPKEIPTVVGGEARFEGSTFESLNPNKNSEVVAKVYEAHMGDVDAAIESANKAYPAWRDTSVEERVGYLVKAAEVLRERMYELCAWQILEVGKQWDQAQGDVAEGIDFLEYYAREMLRVSEVQKLGAIPGEENDYFYEPKGVSVVIAPWNFPLAISIGMVAAALVTGNTVVYKPSELSCAVGYNVVEAFKEVGLPEGVLNLLPGFGATIGDGLVDHKDVRLIAFTGSMATGLKINQRASVVHSGQAYVKKVVCEMGGKNAIIVDDDADLDEAVPQIMKSFIGFQGQKCSACSRLIVLEDIYERTVERLVEAAKSIKIGSPEDPSCDFGAVIDPKAVDKITLLSAIAEKEGTLLYKSEDVPEGGYYVPAVIVEGIEPEDQIAQDEVFGPVLAIMKARDFDHALELANSTQFALTGGVFSRSPSHLERARREFRVGNLYLNQGCTGALVGRQAFGGARMSGMGTKAGGPDYLLHFMDPRVVTENTMRRGFIPEGAE